MLAFFKRRWILLACALAMMGCSVWDWHVHFGSAQTGYCLVAVDQGNSFFVVSDRYVELNGGREVDSVHAPMFGGMPSFMWFDDLKWTRLPLWLPLLPILGWLVFREVRWRAKRRAAAQDV